MNAGEQGVIIPSLNLNELMLRKDVVESVRAGRFHIYAINTIDEGIEVLTGVRAGAILSDGQYEDGTVNRLVDQKLRQFVDTLGVLSNGKQRDASTAAQTKIEESTTRKTEESTKQKRSTRRVKADEATTQTKETADGAKTEATSKAATKRGRKETTR